MFTYFEVSHFLLTFALVFGGRNIIFIVIQETEQVNEKIQSDREMSAIHEAAKALALVAIGYGRAIEHISYKGDSSMLLHTWEPGTPATDREIRSLCVFYMAGYVAEKIADGKGAINYGNELVTVEELGIKNIRDDFLQLHFYFDKQRPKWKESERQQAMFRGALDFKRIFKGKESQVMDLAEKVQAKGIIYKNEVIDTLGKVEFILSMHYDFDGLDQFLHEYDLGYIKNDILKAGLALANIELADSCTQWVDVNFIASVLRECYNLLCTVREAPPETIPSFDREPVEETQPPGTTQADLFGNEAGHVTAHQRAKGVTKKLRKLNIGEVVEYPLEMWDSVRGIARYLRQKEDKEYKVNKHPSKTVATRTK